MDYLEFKVEPNENDSEQLLHYSDSEEVENHQNGHHDADDDEGNDGLVPVHVEYETVHRIPVKTPRKETAMNGTQPSSSTPLTSTPINGEPVKRKRGRPRLSSPKPVPAVKRPRGRPKKDPNAMPPPGKSGLQRSKSVQIPSGGGDYDPNFGGFLSMGHSLFGDCLSSNERLNVTAPPMPKKRGRPRKDSILQPHMYQAYYAAQKTANDSDEMLPNPIEPECIVHHATPDGSVSLSSPTSNQNNHSVRFAEDHELIRSGDVSKFSHNSPDSSDMRSILSPVVKKRGRKKKVPIDEMNAKQDSSIEIIPQQPAAGNIDLSTGEEPVKRKRGRPKGYRPPPKDPSKLAEKRPKQTVLKTMAAQAIRTGLFQQTNGAAHTNGLLNQYKILTNEMKAEDKKPMTNGLAVTTNSKRLMAVNDADASPQFLQSCNTLLNDRNQTLMTTLQDRDTEILMLKAKVAELSAKEKPRVPLPGAPRTEEQFYEAFNLQRLNMKFYNYLIDRMKLPLPSVDEVKQWVQKIGLARGILRTSLGIMKASGLLLDEAQRATFLQVTHVPTRQIYEYDERLDRVYGPVDEMCVVTAQGLYADWSYVIFFDNTCDRDQLNNIIIYLHKIGFSVVGCTLDYKESKMQIYNSACKDRGRCYIPHPITSAEIHCFFYIEDLFAELRRRFLQTGFVSNSGKVSERSIRNILQSQRLEMDIIELGVPGPNDWILAKKLFSRGISQLLMDLDTDDEVSRATGKFIGQMADFYDISTLRRDHKMAYGRNLSAQTKQLEYVKAEIRDLRCIGHSDVELFQTAILMNIDSLKNLHITCLHNYKMDAVSTLMINRNFFHMQMAEIEKEGQSVNLSPLEYIDVINRRFVAQDKRASPAYKPQPCVVRINVNESETANASRLVAWLINVYQSKYPRDKTPPSTINRCLERMEYLFSVYQTGVGEDEGFFKQITDNLHDIPVELARLFARHRQLVRVSYMNTVHELV